MKAKLGKSKDRDAPTSHDQVMVRKRSKDGSTCLVAFSLPQDAAAGAESVAVVGSFNDWDPQAHPMTKLKNGDFGLAIELETGQEHEFRFVIDETRWENAWNADKYVWSEFGNCENSVVIT